MVNLVAETSKSIGHIFAITDHDKILQLRRINHIKIIQVSLAIEGNSLEENQITAILNGKHVLVTTREIREVFNAIEVYEKFEQWNTSSKNSLLDAHGILTKTKSAYKVTKNQPPIKLDMQVLQEEIEANRHEL